MSDIINSRLFYFADMNRACGSDICSAFWYSNTAIINPIIYRTETKKLALAHLLNNAESIDKFPAQLIISTCTYINTAAPRNIPPSIKGVSISANTV
jgi:hypothetical protein